MERILVTGGAGYIGTHLVELLLSQGHRVRVIDNGTFGMSGLRPFYGLSHFEMQQGDIQVTAHLRKAVVNIDKIVHLAGIVGNPACSFDKEICNEVNVVATQKLFDVAAKEKVKHILFASSCSVYGYGEDVFTERSKLNPVDYYSETKIQGEAIAQAYKEDMAVTICRFATVFGASRRMRFDLAVNGMTANAVNRRECIIHGGQQWRPFIHCRDVARAIAIALAAPNEKISGDIYNVGDDKLNINLSGLGKVICSCIPGIVVKSDASITDNRSYKVAFASIRNKLGFAAEYDLKKGIKEIEMLVKSHLIPDPGLNIYSNVKTLEHNLLVRGLP